MLSKILRDRRFHRLALIASVAGMGFALLAWKMGFGPSDAKAAWVAFEDFMRARPWLLFVAIVILPGFPLPISPVMFLAGAIYHEHPILACLGCVAGLLINLIWTYWVAAKPGRGLVHWLLKHWKVQVPPVAAHNHMKWLLIVRLTPGFPIFIQSYLLGFIGIPFLRYLWVSMLCSGSIACGIVLTGAGIGDGRIGPVLGGLGVLVVVMVVVRIVGARLGRAE